MKRLIVVLVLAVVLTPVHDGAAFPYVVQPKESVAQIAERMYGRVELERVIVAANGLDIRRGAGIVAGMRLELPAVSYRKVLPGDSWKSIAAEVLGDAERGVQLAQLNEAKPWMDPGVGREILIPYNLRYVAAGGDTAEVVAYRFMGKRDAAWLVATYNGLERNTLKQGEILLVPLSDLELTEEGKRAARLAGALVRSEGGGDARAAQQLAETELPNLVRDVRRGRYVEAVARGAALLARGGLSQSQLAAVHRQLTEAYVALDESGLGATACAEWQRHDPGAVLDPIVHSPKILAVCIGERGQVAGALGSDAGRDAEDADAAASDDSSGDAAANAAASGNAPGPAEVTGDAAPPEVPEGGTP